MIAVKCARCGRKVFRYVKIGKGKLLRCYKDRIERDYSVRKGDKVLCSCGCLMGIDEGRWIRMVQESFTYTGSVTAK
jgi:hypothetical protein